ncbi:MAG: hypothetical protein DIU72_011685, partial [Pseudomonadota bacterium]
SVIDPRIEDEVKITIIATGFSSPSRAAHRARPATPVQSTMDLEEVPRAPVTNRSTYANVAREVGADLQDELDVPTYLRRELR